MRFLKDLRELKTALGELVESDERREKEATFDLAMSTRDFSRRAKAVVDDKLTFSATLMRAGEVEAANRLLAEVEADVRSEEAALFERVDQVRAARVERRERITRLRVVRMMAVAMLGAAVLGMSAVGMAFAGFIADRSDEQVAARGHAADDRSAAKRRHDARSIGERRRKLKKVRIAGVEVALTPTELRAYQQLASGAVQGDGVEQLLSLLPDELAATIRQVLVAAENTTEGTAKAVADALPRAVAKAKKKAAAKASAQQQQQESDPAQDEEEQDNGEEPTPSPAPSPSDGDGEGSQGQKKERDSGTGLPSTESPI